MYMKNVFKILEYFEYSIKEIFALQEKDVLFELVWRLNTLGWSSRPQYEETWMSLLSVLNVSHDDLTNEEIRET